ncbi:hypothetical protein EN45_042610 [Penicillium chrysogenum]|uniref:Uncharacterized protein n=1 Tax=Penicillium chrysogenum TaxID=5076 RepID=A0A167YG01_PENCH|nr:hypothetical protein EN45_042610 [Penicillium chrysogenum]
MPKRSNEKRLKLNQQCREALAANICTRGPLPTITQLILLDDRLGIVVAPEKVRLQPRPEDGYAWSVTSANASVLKSSLSSAEISKLKAANSSIEIELERTHARLNDCLDESHTVRAEANELRHDMQILRSHNKKLQDELTEAKAGIAGARRILNSLQTEEIGIELGTRDFQSSVNGIHKVASEVLD